MLTGLAEPHGGGLEAPRRRSGIDPEKRNWQWPNHVILGRVLELSSH